MQLCSAITIDFHDDDDDDNNDGDNSVHFFIICVPSQWLRGQLQKQNSVDIGNYSYIKTKKIMRANW
jgi:hypothetical protein